MESNPFRRLSSPLVHNLLSYFILASLLFKLRRTKTTAMTTNLFKADAKTLEALLQKESALYKEALKKDIPFKFIKSIHLRVKCLSKLLIRKKSTIKA
jgi:hypothetical protein